MIQICTRYEIRCLPLLLKPPLLTPPLLKHMRDTILIIAIGKCNRKKIVRQKFHCIICCIKGTTIKNYVFDAAYRHT